MEQSLKFFENPNALRFHYIYWAPSILLNSTEIKALWLVRHTGRNPGFDRVLIEDLLLEDVVLEDVVLEDVVLEDVLLEDVF